MCLGTLFQHDIAEGVEKELTMRSPMWLLPSNPNPSLGRRSIMILNVNHKFARANQEKISENMLYCGRLNHRNKESTTI